MKRIYVLFFLLIASTSVFAQDASDIVNNVFKDIGDCEAVLFVNPSGRGNSPMEAEQYTSDTVAVNGKALAVVSTSGRLEGGSTTATTSLMGGHTTADISFYYQVPTITYSYPRLAVRKDPTPPPYTATGGQVGDCAAYTEWTNTSWTVDTSWHQFTPDLSAMDWTGSTEADFYVNNYAVPLWYLDEIVLTAQSQDTNINNAFAAFGACDGDVFLTASARASYNDTQLQDAQNPTTDSVLGLACEITNASGRLEGKSAPVAIAGSGFSGTDAVFSYYYKVPAQAYSYPRYAVRQDPVDPQSTGEVGDCAAYKEWTNTSWVIDTNWHHFSEELTTLDWTGVLEADFFTNNYATPVCYIDEISLYDPTPAPASVEDWGLF